MVKGVEEMRIEQHKIPSERAEIKVGVDASFCVWIIANTSDGRFANVRFTNKEALAHASTVVDAVNQIHRDCGLSEYEIRQVTEPKQHDPRPEDMAELARLTAMELRKRGILAKANLPNPSGPRHAVVVPNVVDGKQGLRGIVLYASKFDNLGPIGCADVIQAEESRRAQEWAGDP